MAIFHSLEFDGINSLDNGVYITGEAVYNSAERDVEMIEIAGRSGALVMDKGRYKNVSLTYPAGAFGSDQAEFAKKMRQFRNLMATKHGYKRLVDDYHPDEYRMAVFKDAIEVEPVGNSKAGEFELLFDCMPQRYLMSGETPMAISSGDVVFNPTMNDASPLLEVEGYGEINFNGYEIELNDDVFGEITLLSRAKKVVADSASASILRSFDTAYTNTGDVITLNSEGMSDSEGDHDGAMSSDFYVTCSAPYSFGSISKQATNLVYSAAARFAFEPNKMNGVAYLAPVTFSAGTPQTITGSLVATVPVMNNGATAETITVTNTLTLAYDGSGVITTTSEVSITGDSLGIVQTLPTSITVVRSLAVANSTESVLGHPTYLDCDLGVAYRYIGGKAMSLDGYIDLGTNLPVLSSGNNTITFDNTITSLKVTPRWWIL